MKTNAGSREHRLEALDDGIRAKTYAKKEMNPAGKSTSNRRRFNVVVDVETTSISGRKRKSSRR